MRAARWVVIGTAIVAAATAFHMLMTPDGGPRSGARTASSATGAGDRSSDRATAAGRSGWSAEGPSRGAGASPGAGGGGRGSGGAAAGGAPPLDEIDAESREAMRNFLRESARDGTDAKPDGR